MARPSAPPGRRPWPGPQESPDHWKGGGRSPTRETTAIGSARRRPTSRSSPAYHPLHPRLASQAPILSDARLPRATPPHRAQGRQAQGRAAHPHPSPSLRPPLHERHFQRRNRHLPGMRPETSVLRSGLLVAQKLSRLAAAESRCGISGIPAGGHCRHHRGYRRTGSAPRDAKRPARSVTPPLRPRSPARGRRPRRRRPGASGRPGRRPPRPAGPRRISRPPTKSR